MQWMNQSGTLKTTYKARVNFSIGNYVDIVDCTVAPLSACHLLLRRPWQFDLDATHNGHSNKYSFVHKGVHHVLTQMKENDIKAEVFAHIKKKKDAIENTSKPRATLLQGEGNDAASTDLTSAPDVVNKEKIIDAITNCKRIVTVNPRVKEPPGITPNPRTILLQEGENDVCVLRQVQATDVSNNASLLFSVGSRNTSKDQNNSSMHCGSLDSFVVPDLKDDYSSSACKLTEVFNNHLKPRTTLIQGREDDEPMAPNLATSIECQEKCSDSRIVAGNLSQYPIQFGTFSFDRKYYKEYGTNWVVSSWRCGED
jgi:hypothetical protein